MILGLTALGEGRMPTRTRISTWALHMAGALVGGLAAAVGLWLLLSPVRALLPAVVLVAVVVTCAAVAIGVDLGWVRLNMAVRQVPAVWFGRYGPQRSYALYGLMFGSAFSVLRPFAVTYPLFASIALLADLQTALLAGMLFGVGRAVIVGPASYAATAVSRLLFRDLRMHRVWAAVSVLLTIALAFVVLSSTPPI